LVEKDPQPQFAVEPLGKKHDRAAFSCTNQELERYLKTQAGQDFKKHAAAPYVLTPDHKTIAGFYTLSQYSIDLNQLPADIVQHFPKYPQVSATLLGRLAIDKQFLGQGLGKILLMDALNRALILSKQAASAAVVVGAKDDNAETFYTRYGFIALPNVPRRLFIPMQTIAQLFPEDAKS